MAKYTRVAGYLSVPSYPCRVVTGNLFGHMCGVGYVDLPGSRNEQDSRPGSSQGQRAVAAVAAVAFEIGRNR